MLSPKREKKRRFFRANGRRRKKVIRDEGGSTTAKDSFFRAGGAEVTQPGHMHGERERHPCPPEGPIRLIPLQKSRSRVPGEQKKKKESVASSQSRGRDGKNDR